MKKKPVHRGSLSATPRSRGDEQGLFGPKRSLEQLLMILRGDKKGVQKCTPSRRIIGTGCPRCGGYVYRGTIPLTGTLSASVCVNCGWQGHYTGAPVDELALARAKQRVFDFDVAQEQIRRSLRVFRSRKGWSKEV